MQWVYNKRGIECCWLFLDYNTTGSIPLPTLIYMACEHNTPNTNRRARNYYSITSKEDECKNTMKATTQWKQLHNESNYIIKATTQWKQLHNESNYTIKATTQWKQPHIKSNYTKKATTQ